MTARRKKAAPRAAASELSIYSGRDLAGSIVVVRKGQVTALDADGKARIFATEARP